MVTYLSSVEKHMYGIPYIDFRLYNNIVSPNWVDMDPCPKKGVVEVNFKVLKKASTILASHPSSYCWNALNNIPSIACVSHNKSSIPTSISLFSSPTHEELVTTYTMK